MIEITNKKLLTAGAWLQSLCKQVNVIIAFCPNNPIIKDNTINVISASSSIAATSAHKIIITTIINTPYSQHCKHHDVHACPQNAAMCLATPMVTRRARWRSAPTTLQTSPASPGLKHSREPPGDQGSHSAELKIWPQ